MAEREEQEIMRRYILRGVLLGAAFAGLAIGSWRNEMLGYLLVVTLLAGAGGVFGGALGMTQIEILREQRRRGLSGGRH